MINDVSGGLFDEKMSLLTSEFNKPVVIMHSRGNPGNMDKQNVYDGDLINVVSQELKERVEIFI